MVNRISKVNQLIKEELSHLLLREIEFPSDFLVTLTRVESSANLIQAKVFISVLPEGKIKEVLQVLNKQIYQLQQKINRRLKMRPVPQIIFIEERKTIEANKVEEILEELKKKEN
ncbi:MAG: 30S ribosome-binding factor RbfA [Patescibacteria group bacterium]